MEGDGHFSTRGLPMPAHSGEIIGEIAPRSVAIHHAQFFGIQFVMKGPGSAAKSMLRDGRAHHGSGTHDKATHTDPQLLFLAAS
jgi:hypothetical protein